MKRLREREIARQKPEKTSPLLERFVKLFRPQCYVYMLFVASFSLSASSSSSSSLDSVSLAPVVEDASNTRR